MMTQSLVRQITDRLVSEFADIQAIYVYGSVAAGTDGSDSDLDIGLLLPPVPAKTLEPLSLLDVKIDLESIAGRTVDLVNLRRTSVVLQKEVLAGGTRVYTGDEYAAEVWEMLVLSLYGKLNEERAEILADFAQTGRAYRL